MSKMLANGCVTINEADIPEKDTLTPDVMMKITNRAFKKDDRLMRMSYYSPYIIKKALCLLNYTLVKFVATGNGGMVNVVRDNRSGKEFVVKLMEYSIGFVFEALAGYKFMNLGIGVDIHKICRVNLEMNDYIFKDPHTDIVTQNTKYVFKIGLVVMEKIETTLSQLLYCNPSSENDAEIAAIIAPQLVDAFRIMEENNCCHYDLHGGNIGLLPGNKVKFIDFGYTSLEHSYISFSAGSLLRDITPNEGNIGFMNDLYLIIGQFLIDRVQTSIENTIQLPLYQRKVVNVIYNCDFDQYNPEIMNDRKRIYYEDPANTDPTEDPELENEWKMMKNRPQSQPLTCSIKHRKTEWINSRPRSA